MVASPSVATPDTDTILTAVAAVSSTNVWAVGWRDQYSSQTTGSVIEHWNGTSWTLLPQTPGEPIDSTLLGVAVLGTTAYAVGGTSATGPLVEACVGMSWSVEPTLGAQANWSLNAVVASSIQGIWAVGTAGIPSLVMRPNIRH